MQHDSTTHIDIISHTVAQVQERSYKCATGKGGIRVDKKEGDGATPVGEFSLRRLFYRPDRIAVPETGLPAVALGQEMGWCDDPASAFYNQLVTLPFAPRHEILWRDDNVYDIIIEVGYNDAPIVPGKGSAIFIHLARENYTPTEGCVAFCLPDLLDICRNLTVASKLRIRDNTQE